ncbi:hypothetical protein BJX64DRAFT_160471 [Aspergillus heterothallicus]
MQDYSTPSSDSQRLRPSHQTTTADSSSSLYPFATVLEVCVLFFSLLLHRLPFFLLLRNSLCNWGGSLQPFPRPVSQYFSSSAQC